jgi:SAM-dependent MidA family methyltransferase
LTAAAEKIAQDIERHGAISFARFMELALYCPVCGYYEKEEDTIGRQGDYYTSVSVGSLFGELLAFQFARWIGDGAEGGGFSRCDLQPVEIVEAGAHRGELARDILNWTRVHTPELLQRLTYWIVEPSERRRHWQQRTLAGFSENVRWTHSLLGLVSPSGASGSCHSSPVTRPKLGVEGIIFANELLDALPAHRVGWDASARTWFEWGVTRREGRFVWTRLSEDASDLVQRSFAPQLIAQVGGVLPDGYTVEVCPAAQDWWRAAASVLTRGKLLALDYGLAAEELFAPQRNAGTLRAYCRHQLHGDVLAYPGEQDLTAHVNFSAVQGVGEPAGLITEAFLTQERFLTQIAKQAWEEHSVFGPWTVQHTRQFQTLTHPEHLGRSFRVLIQARP